MEQLLIKIIYPPLQTIKIDTPLGEIIASTFKTGKDNDEKVKMEDIKKLHQLHNYSNQILHNIAKQVDSLSIEIKTLPKSIPKFPQNTS